MSESIPLGIDHGYAAMKTAHCSYPTGLVGYEHEPYTQQNVLEYGGKFYVVGSGRQPLQKDKTLTEDYYLLTLAAIAREAGPLRSRHHRRCPSGGWPAPHQLRAGQEEISGLPAPGRQAGDLPL